MPYWTIAIAMPREVSSQYRLPYSTSKPLFIPTVIGACAPHRLMTQVQGRFLECKHAFRVRLTLWQSQHQVTSVLTVFDTFTEKSTFFQKYTTPLKYSIKMLMLKNHHPRNLKIFWQSH